MNGEMNVFNPVDLDMSRSTFVGHPTRTGTCNVGRLIPAFFMEVQPGDSIKMDLRTLFKMSTPVYPTMDELFADVSFFFVPNKLVLSERYGSPSITGNNKTWKAIVGAQSNIINVPVPANGLKVPCMHFVQGASYGTLTDYIYPGIAHDDWDNELSCLPYLAYFSIYNENYRDPNLMDNVTWDFDATYGWLNPYGVVPLCATSDEIDQALGNTPTGNYLYTNALNPHYVGSIHTSAAPAAETWLPFPTCRFHGYFGSALPWPQRNAVGVELPLGDKAPVFAGGTDYVKIQDERDYLRGFIEVNGRVATQATSVNLVMGGRLSDTGPSPVATDSNTATPGLAHGFVPSNLYADLRSATAANVNALRAAIQKQRWYEKIARSGSRYDEMQFGLFGVRPKDSGLDRPLYLGGKRIPLNITMVASTNGGTSSSSGIGGGSLGSLGAFSHTNDNGHYFYHSFDDWGTLMCVFTVRHHTTVAGGIEKSWLRLTRDDMYFPTFAHLGEESLSKALITGDHSDKSAVFGYQEAWADYRYWRDSVCGLLTPGENLAFMTYAEHFGQGTPLVQYLNASFQVESVDNTLAVKSYASGFQLVYQMTFDIVARRCMPEYSWPGLVDHF